MGEYILKKHKQLSLHKQYLSETIFMAFVPIIVSLLPWLFIKINKTISSYITDYLLTVFSVSTTTFFYILHADVRKEVKEKCVAREFFCVIFSLISYIFFFFFDVFSTLEYRNISWIELIKILGVIGFGLLLLCINYNESFDIKHEIEHHKECAEKLKEDEKNKNDLEIIELREKLGRKDTEIMELQKNLRIFKKLLTINNNAKKKSRQ